MSYDLEDHGDVDVVRHEITQKKGKYFAKVVTRRRRFCGSRPKMELFFITTLLSEWRKWKSSRGGVNEDLTAIGTGARHSRVVFARKE